MDDAVGAALPLFLAAGRVEALVGAYQAAGAHREAFIVAVAAGARAGCYGTSA